MVKQDPINCGQCPENDSIPLTRKLSQIHSAVIHSEIESRKYIDNRMCQNNILQYPGRAPPRIV